MATYLDDLIKAYIECALWSSMDETTDAGGYPLDETYGPEDVEATTRKEMESDCADFLGAACKELGQASLSAEQAGHDFWLTRNGHGAGFWDRGLGEVGDKLTGIAKVYGGFDLYVSDENEICGGK